MNAVTCPVCGAADVTHIDDTDWYNCNNWKCECEWQESARLAQPADQPIPSTEPIIRIQPNGRLFWRGREVETDAGFRAAMMDFAGFGAQPTPPTDEAAEMEAAIIEGMALAAQVCRMADTYDEDDPGESMAVHIEAAIEARAKGGRAKP